MNEVSKYLEQDHARCDQLYADAVTHVAARDWEQAAVRFADFAEAQRLHIEMEESVLYPAFEQAAGTSTGPTLAMRAEHHLLREILFRLSEAINRRSVIEFSDHADTFHLITQQHNLKEEGMLFPLIDKMLRHRYDELVQAMTAMRPAAAIQTT
ncbi:MAG TPA: hemerythrin domain-containing protein [Telluria sp.]|jgi:hemerythrin-like domain-containing protein|nr:hemerythrin domain-containing protein [Telluria sp.]